METMTERAEAVDNLSQPGPRLSVVTPCYNEEDSLDELHSRVAIACWAVVRSDYEIVLVNDGSRDQTWMRMALLAERDSSCSRRQPIAQLWPPNSAERGAKCVSRRARLCSGCRPAGPPELLAPMMARMDAGADVVYGQRITRAGETAFKRLTARLFYRLFRRLVDIEIALDAGDFRLMSRRVVDIINAMPEQHRFIRGMVGWIGLNQEALPYDRAAPLRRRNKVPVS